MISMAWTLLHFLWQGAVLALVLAGANLILRKSSARLRYAAACTTMLLMLASAIATFVWLDQRMAQPAQSGVSGRLPQLSSWIAAPSQTDPSAPPDYLVWLVYAWMIGVLVLSIRSSHAWIAAQTLKRRQAWPASTVWQERLELLARRLAISRPVRLCESAIAEAPAVIGWLRPVILAPASTFVGLQPTQIEAVLAHELAHVRRHDYFVNLIQTAIETLLFYHPAVWWVGRRIRAERENCCDDIAVSICGDVLTYARALTQLEQMRSGTRQLAMAANAGSLLERIRRLIAPKAAHRMSASDWLTPVAVLISAAAIWAASGTAPRNHFPIAHFAAFQAAQHLPVPPAPAREPEPAETQETAEPAETPDPPGSPEPAQAPAQPTPSGTGSYIGDLAAAGYSGLTVDQLISLKIHGVTPELIRALQAAGFKPTVDQLVSLRIHGATPDYAKEIKALGLGEPSIDDLIALLIHGATPDYGRQMKATGLRGLSLARLIAMRIHGISPAGVREAQKHFKDLDADQVIKLKQAGILPSSETI